MNSLSPVARRLLPLYLGAFLQSLVFWYSIEKLFMTSIGFTATTIGLMGAIYSVVMLFIETPSGLLADRWSRKGILIIGSVMLALASLICGISQSVVVFIVGSALWGVFYALYSGTYDTIVYDTLLEETGSTDGFKQRYGMVKMLDGMGLVVGSIAGAVMADSFGLRSTFFWSIPAALAAGIVLFIFREPKLHQAEVMAPIAHHVKSTFAAVLHRGTLLGMLIILVLGTVINEIIFEFVQVWWITISTPVTQFGLAMALILSTVSFAGLLAPRLHLEKRSFVVLFTAIMLTSALALTFVRSTWPLVIAQTIICIGLIAAGIIYLERLHDRLPSNIRSGASSAVSTMGRVLFIFAALGFGWVSEHYSVFRAGWLIVIPLILICLFLYKDAPLTSRTEAA